MGYACTERERKRVLRVLRMLRVCPKLVVNKNWWCGAGQMLASSLMAQAVYHSYINPLVPK
jgi:hypothetical protein